MDQYSEKYAVLTWLIPTTPNPKNFDPSLFVLGIIIREAVIRSYCSTCTPITFCVIKTFILWLSSLTGPEEDSPKDMECLEFVSHSPQSAGFLPSLSRDTDLAKLWNSKRRRIMFTS